MRVKTYDTVKELDIYFKEINKYKCLSKEEEAELSKKIRNGDEKSFNKLINSNLRFVVNIAKGYRDSGIPFQDIISEGNLGLIKAAQKFDYTKDVRFISYAVWWVKSYIQAYIDSRVKKNEVSVDDYMIVDIEDNSDDEHCKNSINKEFEDELSKIQDKQDSLMELMECLQEREVKILMMYFGLSYNNKEMTLDEISSEMNMSKERVRQIKDKALIKLRTEALLSNNFYEYQELI